MHVLSFLKESISAAHSSFPIWVSIRVFSGSPKAKLQWLDVVDMEWTSGKWCKNLPN